ncbi:hypothetical protein [Leptospira santarosai]|uniref:hypothetical protein n=1 Tax=Leptospira santarosai TaxID=28183 RepID=UPI000A42BB5D|nr:hypothetical protein [Leptospira santarosai]
MRKQNHNCHAIGCNTKTKPEMFMCLKHWRMVSKRTQQLIWKYYRPGQCDDWKPSSEYCASAKLALCEVATKEKISVSGDEEEPKLYDWLMGKPTA